MRQKERAGCDNCSFSDRYQSSIVAWHSHPCLSNLPWARDGSGTGHRAPGASDGGGTRVPNTCVAGFFQVFSLRGLATMMRPARLRYEYWSLSGVAKYRSKRKNLNRNLSFFHPFGTKPVSLKTSLEGHFIGAKSRK